MRRMFLTGLMIVALQGSARPQERQVNDRTSGAQANAAVAARAGNAVIVWSSYYSTGGQSNNILARRFSARNGLLGEEFRIDLAVSGNQTEPAVAMDGQGGFAVVWQGPGFDKEDIFLRLFQSGGRPATDELLVNLDFVGRQIYPRVAASETGALVVVWESRVTVEGNQSATVEAQRFDPNGAALGGALIVDPSVYDSRYPEVAMDAAGRFAVAWMRDRSNHPIMVRLFDAEGRPVTEPLEVNTAGISSITRPSVAMNSLGYSVVTWDGHPSRASEDDIYARLYDPNGVPRGEPFIVNTVRAGTQQWPQAAINDANEFVVVWEHDTADVNATEIAARCFDATGAPVGDQFQLNTYTLDAQRSPDVAMLPEGRYLATWESNRQDGSGYGVFAAWGSTSLPAESAKDD